MAYILVVQPATLSTDLAGRPSGLDFGAVFLASAIAAGIGLLRVGSMMMAGAARIAWDDPAGALPVFLAIVGIPPASSIADRLALGFVAYPIVESSLGAGARSGGSRTSWRRCCSRTSCSRGTNWVENRQSPVGSLLRW